MELNAAQLLAVEYIIAFMGLFLGFKCISLRRNNMNYFLRFVVVLNAFLLINIPIRYSELHLVVWNRMFVFVIYALSVVLMTFTAAYWCMFILKQLNSPIVADKIKVHIYLFPTFLTVPLCIINYWTGWLYSIGENSFYTRGSVFFLQSAISYIYIVLVISCGVFHLIIDNDKTTAKKALFCSVPSLIGSALQIFFGGSYLLAGVLITGWTMYIEICLDRQKAFELSEAVQSINDELIHSNNAVAQNMRTILALSDIYYILFEVDLVNDTFKELKAPDYVSEFCHRYTSARACLRDIPEGMFNSAYLGLMKTFFDVDMINEFLGNKNSYFVDAKGKHVTDWVRSTMIASERDQDGKVTRIVYTIEEIGDIIEQQKKIEEAKIYEMHAKQMDELFIQTADALASAIDAKDKYTHGHSKRVAEYSRQIAIATGKSEEICENVYIAGLLHDVGKIGIRDAILTKTGRLSDEEFSVIKQHPNLGNNILSGITITPYLSIGAHYHHERYDGKGYPEGLKGEEIPELARIIAVADSYDAMTSSRSYRTPLAQQKVREELAKGIGTQFDPQFAKAMIHILDKDTEYKLKDDNHCNEFLEEYFFEEYKKQCTDGIHLSDCITRVTFSYEAATPEKDCMPSLIFFDSLDERIYTDEADKKKMEYTDFCDIPIQGDIVTGTIRECKINEYVNDESEKPGENEVIFDTVRQRDHIFVKIYTKDSVRECTIALRDRSQFAYVAVTGKQCRISKFSVQKSINSVEEGYIKRIAEEVSYIKGCEEGDLSNLEIAGWREDHSEGIPVDGKLEISFHTMSLPAATRIWHCPIIVFFTSENGMVYGPGYREFALVRFDGESWEEDKAAFNKIEVAFDEAFDSWDHWKKINKEGIDCTIHMERQGDNIVLQANEGGVMINNTTMFSESIPKLYFALTGDQVAITTIHVERN